MRFLTALWQHLAGAAAPRRAEGFAASLLHDEAGDDACRKSIHDVTLEQWGIDHWSCHTLF